MSYVSYGSSVLILVAGTKMYKILSASLGLGFISSRSFWPRTWLDVEIQEFLWPHHVPLGLPPFLVPLLIFTKALPAYHTVFCSVRLWLPGGSIIFWFAQKHCLVRWWPWVVWAYDRSPVTIIQIWFCQIPVWRVEESTVYLIGMV